MKLAQLRLSVTSSGLKGSQCQDLLGFLITRTLQSLKLPSALLWHANFSWASLAWELTRSIGLGPIGHIGPNSSARHIR